MDRQQLHPGLNVADALSLPESWSDMRSPRAIVTSPPYLDMHDYGNSSRIGTRGQSLDEYLDLMTTLFQNCHQISTHDATFWLIVGNLRRRGHLIQLPALLAQRAETVGWNLRESITWDKGKALPWVHHGELRDVTEQIMLLSKTSDYHFDPTDIRSPIPSSVWWRRYPERYSPAGRMPTNLWEISIPTQGSWTGIRSHFCPFPSELTYRVISLTTVKGDVVLDPLAGVGSVPAMANAMGRIGYGLELTPAYVSQYDTTFRMASEFLENLANDEERKVIFRETILGLRLLKFAKVLGQDLHYRGIAVDWVRVTQSAKSPHEPYKHLCADVDIVLPGTDTSAKALELACQAISRAPLSKFGIQACLTTSITEGADRSGYWYPSGNFWNPPSKDMPHHPGPHVVSDYCLNVDLIDDTPYI